MANMVVVKRDKTKVPFEIDRITNAIYKAAQSVGGTNRDIAEHLAYLVKKQLEQTIVITGINTVSTQKEWAVEDIQDIVEKTLIENGHARTAKSYILYRQKRTDARELSSKLQMTIHDLVSKDAAEVEDKRENANINGDTSAGSMLKVGGTVMKDFVLRNCMKPKHAEMHRRGEIHYHK